MRKPCSLALALLIDLSLLTLPTQAQSVPTRDEICYSPSFAALPGNPDRPFCINAPPPSRPTGNEVFWIPMLNRLTGGSCVPSGNVSASLPSSSNIFIVNLLNLNAGRLATVTGNGNANVLVASPNTSDRLIGGGGLDTYVVGGLQNRLTVIPPDTIIVDSGTRENDVITFGGATEYVHINASFQSTPGAIETPLPPRPGDTAGSRGGRVVMPRGSGVITTPLLDPSPTPTPNCKAALPRGDGLARLTYPLLAFNAAALSSYGGIPVAQSPILPMPARPQINPSLPRLARDGLKPCDPNQCGPGNNQYRDPLGEQQRFPGAPTLVGFSIDPANPDRIFLPAERFTFLGEPMQKRISANGSMKVRVVRNVKFRSSQGIGKAERAQLRSNSRGLQGLSSDEAPLFYFPEYGLLVSSSNGDPLGSETNPGIVIAQLLTEQGRPLELDAGDRDIYEAAFIDFRPQQPAGEPHRQPKR